MKRIAVVSSTVKNAAIFTTLLLFTCSAWSAEHVASECPKLDGDYCSEETESVPGGTRTTETCITKTLFYTDLGHLILSEGYGNEILVDGVAREYERGTAVAAYCKAGALHTVYSSAAGVVTNRITTADGGKTLKIEINFDKAGAVAAFKPKIAVYKRR
jgi:hypothetical protein